MVTATRPTKVKQLEDPLAGRRWDNHPHALRAIRSKAKRKIIRAGRQGGKTTIAGKLTCDYYGRGLPVLYAVPTAEQLNRWWFEVKLVLRPLIDKKVVKVNETEHTITVPGTEQQIKGKAQPLTALVYTPNGPKPMGTIKVGDKVLTPFGTVTDVTAVYPQGEQDIYEVEFRDGTKAECTADHLWEVQRFKSSQANHSCYTVVTTRDLIEHPKIVKFSSQASCRPRVRLTECAPFASQTVPLDPYLVGALIGDGKLEANSSPIFSTADTWVLSRVKALLPSTVRAQAIPATYDYRLAPEGEPIRGRSPLRAALRDLGLLGKRSHEKFIPDCYKYNSEAVRLDCLRGLFDTDGFVSRSGQVQFTTTSERLAQDVREVIESLGGITSIRQRSSGYRLQGTYHACRVSYILEVLYRDTRELFSLPRKRDRTRLRTVETGHINRSIKSIRFVRRDQAQCIKIADERRLYLTDHFIPTHNTAWDPDSLRGGNWALIIYDEWQLMDEDTHKVVGDPMLLKWDGDAIFIYTPPSLRSRSRSKARDPRHAAKLYKEHEHDTDGVWECFHFTSLDNPYLPRVSLDRIAQDMTREDYRKEILAEDDDLELTRLVYAAFKDSQWIAPFDIPKTWLCHSWHDFGQANPAALFVAQNNDKTPFSTQEGQVIQPGDCVIWHEYRPGAGKSTAWHVAQFEDIVEGRKMSVRVGGNPTTEDEIRQGYGAHGWPIKAPRWTRPKEQIARTIAHMEKGRIWAFRTLHNFREEMANALWDADDEGYRLDKIQNEPRYHLLAALRYGASEMALEVPLGRKVTPVTYL